MIMRCMCFVARLQCAQGPSVRLGGLALLSVPTVEMVLNVVTPDKSRQILEYTFSPQRMVCVNGILIGLALHCRDSTPGSTVGGLESPAFLARFTAAQGFTAWAV